MKVGDMVICTMLADKNVGVVVLAGERVTRVHFINPEQGRANPRWVSVEYLEVINENR